MEVLIHPGAHKGDGADGAHECAYLKGADERLYAAGAAVEKRFVILPLEVKVKAGKGLFKGILVDFSVRGHAVLHGKEGYAAVHCAAVKIKEAEFLGNHLCECAFAGR